MTSIKEVHDADPTAADDLLKEPHVAIDFGTGSKEAASITQVSKYVRDRLPDAKELFDGDPAAGSDDASEYFLAAIRKDAQGGITLVGLDDTQMGNIVILPIAEATDTDPPVIHSFYTSNPSQTDNTVFDLTWVVTDNIGVKYWAVHVDSAIPPLNDASSPSWQDSVITTIDVLVPGLHILYAWAMDEALNISSLASWSIEVVGTAAPVITSLVIADPAIDTSNASVTTFNTTGAPTHQIFRVDNDTTPPLDDPEWSAIQTAPFDVDIPGPVGNHIVRGWVRTASYVSLSVFVAVSKTESAPSTTLIMDNGESGTSQVGVWNDSSAVDYYLPNTSVFNSSNAGFPGDYYSWEFTGLDAGDYDVSAWWTYFGNRTNVAPYEIYADSVLVDSLTKNHQIDAAQFNMLGTYSVTATLEVRVGYVAGGNSVSADAIKIVTSGASGAVTTQYPPDTSDDVMYPRDAVSLEVPVYTSETVTFTIDTVPTTGVVGMTVVKQTGKILGIPAAALTPGQEYQVVFHMAYSNGAGSPQTDIDETWNFTVLDTSTSNSDIVFSQEWAARSVGDYMEADWVTDMNWNLHNYTAEEGGNDLYGPKCDGTTGKCTTSLSGSRMDLAATPIAGIDNRATVLRGIHTAAIITGGTPSQSCSARIDIPDDGTADWNDTVHPAPTATDRNTKGGYDDLYWHFDVFEPARPSMYAEKHGSFGTGSKLEMSHTGDDAPLEGWAGYRSHTANYAVYNDNAWGQGDNLETIYWYDADQVQRNDFMNPNNPDVTDKTDPNWVPSYRTFGVWRRYIVRKSMNTAGTDPENPNTLKDGWLEVWKSGKKVLSKAHRWRHHDGLHNDGFWLMEYWNANALNPPGELSQDYYVYYDNMFAAKAPMGILDGSTPKT